MTPDAPGDSYNIGHAARAAEGRTLWILAWKEAWEAADQAAAYAEKHPGVQDPAGSRQQWALKMAAARDTAVPWASDAIRNIDVVPAWNNAWYAAWNAAIDAAHVSLTERDEKELSGTKKWDKAGRAARAAAGLAAGCEAWNEVYRAEIRKNNL